MKRYFWNGTYAKWAELDGIVTPTLIENYLVPEGKENMGHVYRDIWKGLFKAPVTGDYKFFISGDDDSEFYFDTTPFNTSVDTYSPTKIASNSRKANAYHDFTA